MNVLIKLITAIFVSVLQFVSSLGISSEPEKPVDSYGGGDPFLVEDSGFLYYTYTTGSGIVIRKIDSLENKNLIEEKQVYSQGNNGILREIWAPEIHRIGDRWYIVSCALFDSSAVPRGAMPYAENQEEHTDYYRYGFVLESKTDDIYGEYEFKAVLAPDGLNNIDGTFLKHGGNLYYVCSAYLKPAHQCIYISEMTNPYTLKSDSEGVMLSKPEYKWEKNGWWVNEGPAVLYAEDEIYLFYSASGYSSGEYCMGMLSLTGDDVMNKNSWYKSPVTCSKSNQKNLFIIPDTAVSFTVKTVKFI